MTRVSVEVQQGEIEEGLTKADVKWSAMGEEEGRAQMTAAGANGEAMACVAINIALLDGIGAEAEGELQALYDQLYDMANGDEAIEELKEQFFLQGKPLIQIREVDGAMCLQIVLSFTMDPFAEV